MTEPNTPDQQVSTPDQQVDWQSRYNGQQAKLQQLTESNRLLTEQLAAANTRIAHLEANLGVKDAEKNQLVSQHQSSNAALQQENHQLTAEIARLKATQTKLETIKKLNRPELIGVMDAIPASDDPAQMEAAFTAVAGLADSMVQARERQLTAGVLPVGGGQALPARPTPQTTADWEKHLNSLTLGSKERERAMADWYDWSRANPNK